MKHWSKSKWYLIFNKAFRPGIVDMSKEQAVASSGAITLPETMNEFDILLSDPILDLNALLQNPSQSKANQSRMQDITMEQTFISFSQDQQNELLEQQRSSESFMDTSNISIEVGRDAASSQIYDVAKDATIDSSLLEKDALVSMQLPRADQQVEDILGEQGAMDFGFDFGEPLDFIPPMYSML
jgi:hypothetical protein